MTLGKRIQVTGTSCAGKSTTSRALAEELGVPYVELDALNWEANWVAVSKIDPERFKMNLNEATAGDAWIVDGSYFGFSMETYFPRLQTIVWLDLPRWLLLCRVVIRSWQRAHSDELLWGVNREPFWSQFKVWDHNSLIWWIWTQHARKRREMEELISDPTWEHLQVIRLRSVKEIDQFLAGVEVDKSTIMSG